MFVKSSSALRYLVLLAGISLLLVSSSLKAQKENETRRLIRVKNKVKEIREYKHNLETGDSSLYNVDFFNADGRISQGLYFDEEGNITNRQLFEFDSRGYSIKQVNYDDKDLETGMFTYEYDKDGNRIDYKQIRKGRVLVHQKRKYKKSRNTELINKMHNANYFFVAAKFSYTPKGEFKKVKNYSPNGNLVSVEDYVYNRVENKVEQFRTEGKNKRLKLIEYFNNSGLPLKLIYPKKVDRYEGYSLKTLDISKEVWFAYDKNGNLISELTFEDSQLVRKRTWSIISEK